MTIIDIIRQADIRQPNSIDTRQKLRWLWGLDMQLCCEMPGLICAGRNCPAHEGGNGNNGAELTAKPHGALCPAEADSCHKQHCPAGTLEQLGSCPCDSGMCRSEAPAPGSSGCCHSSDSTSGQAADCPKFKGRLSAAPYESGSEEPLLPERWEELYCHYLVAQISAVHGETERYNRAIALYNSTYSALVSHYLRCRHRPRPTAFGI